MTIDERIEALTQSVELMAQIHKTDWEKTQQQIQALIKQTTRFQFWAEAIILNYDSRLRALAKELPPAESPS